MLSEVISTITHLRMLLCNSLRRRGDMTDYRVILALQSFRYMGLHGVNDPYRENLSVIVAANSAYDAVETLIKSDKSTTST